MIEGTLIMESLGVGTNLESLRLTVRKISRYRAQGTSTIVMKRVVDDRPLAIAAAAGSGPRRARPRAKR
jgi:hypothetical protein